MSYTAKVEWSVVSVIITIVVTLIIIAVGYSCLVNEPIEPIKLSIFCLLVIGLILIGSLVPSKIEIVSGELLIHRLIGVKHISITNILECNRSFTPSRSKICGSGGLCGNIGWYNDSELGTYFSYVLNRKQAFYLVLKDGKKYMLSCKGPDKIVYALKDMIVK